MKKVITFLVVVILAIFIYRNFIENKDGIKNIQKTVQEMSSGLVRMDGEVPYIKLKGSWVKLEDVKILNWNAFEPIKMEYDGEEITFGDSGLVNTLKFLSRLGLISNLKGK